MNFNISIIIINWNGWEDTLECLESLYQINYSNYNIIVVDNNSNDDSMEKIKEYCKGQIVIEPKFCQYNPDNKPIKLFEYNKNELKVEMNLQNDFNSSFNKIIFLIKNNVNLGFAEGNNVGIKFALNNLNPDYILLLNNDTVVDPDFLTELIKIAEIDKEIGFVGAKTYFYDKKNTIQIAGGGYIDFKQVIAIENGLNQIDSSKYNKNYPVDYVSGSCMLCKREVLDKIGLLNTNYFMYWEDVDWCFRGKKLGYKSFYAFKSKIWHKTGVSSNNYFKIYYYTRNRIYFMKQNFNDSNYIKSLIYFFICIFLPQSATYLVNKDLKGFKPYLRGIINGFYCLLNTSI